MHKFINAVFIFRGWSVSFFTKEDMKNAIQFFDGNRMYERTISAVAPNS